MPKISVTATCKRNARGFFEDVVIVMIAGVAFETRCDSPERARELALKITKELGL